MLSRFSMGATVLAAGLSLSLISSSYSGNCLAQEKKEKDKVTAKQPAKQESELAEDYERLAKSLEKFSRSLEKTLDQSMEQYGKELEGWLERSGAEMEAQAEKYSAQMETLAQELERKVGAVEERLRREFGNSENVMSFEKALDKMLAGTEKEIGDQLRALAARASQNPEVERAREIEKQVQQKLRQFRDSAAPQTQSSDPSVRHEYLENRLAELRTMLDGELPPEKRAALEKALAQLVDLQSTMRSKRVELQSRSQKPQPDQPAAARIEKNLLEKIQAERKRHQQVMEVLQSEIRKARVDSARQWRDGQLEQERLQRQTAKDQNALPAELPAELDVLRAEVQKLKAELESLKSEKSERDRRGGSR